VTRRPLIAVAAPAEARAVLDGLRTDPTIEARPWVLHPFQDADIVMTGVGKANAAGAVARLADSSRHAWILSTGVAGALPGSGLAIGQTILATASVFADEGLQAEDRFSDCAQMGFPLADFPGSAVPLDPALQALLRPLADREGPIATVSTCSGLDALARTIRDRTLALAEAMEGAAVGLVARRLGIPAAELRVISNTTGDRARQRWDLPAALTRLSDLAARLPLLTRG
jgi:futalosine hydrolase